ncbi:MAG: cell division protein FtsQ [Lachnospiraceae bacterium]|nr:cell division protein FtsQ [Lachnospiraceae bacterium]
MKKILIRILIILAVLAAILCGVAYYILTEFKIEDIEVAGSIHYTDDEIKQFVLNDEYFIDNTLLLNIKNKFKPMEDIPFIEKMDIDYLTKNSMRITVYEKAIAGSLNYMNRYIYFDKDGIVLDTSATKLDDIPCISGMSFDSVVLYEKLPIDDEDRFMLILKLTQLITKYKLRVDDIRFTSNDEIIIYEGDIKILLGKGEDIEEKMVDLGSILTELKDKKGTLDLREFTREKGSASFKKE